MKKLTDYIAEAEQTIAEKAVSQQQQKFMGMVHAMQNGKKIKGASPELRKAASSMSPRDAMDFASTPHKGLPKQVNEAPNRYYDVTTTILNPAFAAWENGQGDEDNPPEEELEVGVDYSMSGSYKPATWGYNGGEPEEYPEIDEYTVYDLATGREIENIDDHAHNQIVKAITAAAENRSDDYYDEGIEEDAPAMAKMAGGLGLGLVAAAGAPAIVGILGPLLGIPLAAYGAYSAAKMGMTGVEKLWDMATEKLGSSEKVEQYATAQIAKLPPEKAQGASAIIKQVSESRKTMESLGDVSSTFDHVCKTFSHECKRFKESNGLDLDRDLFHALYDYYFDDMPYGIKKDRDGDSFEWVSNRFRDDLQLGQTSTPAMSQHQGEMDTLRKMAGLPPKIHSAF